MEPGKTRKKTNELKPFSLASTMIVNKVIINVINDEI